MVPGRLKHIPLLVILLMYSSIAVTQDYIDLVKLNYTYAPVSTFDNSSEGTSLNVVSGDLTLPIVINEQATFLTGVSFENIRGTFDPGRTEESVNGIIAKLGINLKHNSNWSGTYMFLPKLSSDFKEVTNSDWQLGGLILMKSKKTMHLNYKFGLYGNTELFGPFIVPLFGVYYLSPSEKFEAKVLLPLSIDLNYVIAAQTRIGINFNGEVRTYNLNTPVNTEPYRYLEKNSNDLYTYLQYELKNGVVMQAGCGRSIGRSYRLYDEKVSFGMPLVKFGNERTQLNSDFSDGWLLKATAIYRLDLGDSAEIK